MSFIARALQEAQRRIAARHAQAFRAARKKYLFLPLGQAHDRELVETHLLRGVQRCAELPLAAVDHHEIRQRRLLVSPASQVSGNHFVNCREIVLLRHALDLEFPVLALFGRPASNHTSEPTMSRPWLFEMSTQTRLLGTTLRPRSRPRPYTGSSARSSVSNDSIRRLSSKWRAFWSASSRQRLAVPRCGTVQSLSGRISRRASKSSGGKGSTTRRTRFSAGT